MITLEQIKDLGYNTFSYHAGGFSYEDGNGLEYLIIDGVEVASAEWVFQYAHDVWETQDTSGGAYTLFYKGEKVCEGYYFRSTIDENVYIVVYENGDERTIDVTDRTTWQ